MISSGKINNNQGKAVLEEMFATGESPKDIVEKKGLTVIQDQNFLEDVIKAVLNDHGDLVERYQNGEERLFGFFVGQVMRSTKGRAEPVLVNKLLADTLKSGRNWEPRKE